MKAYKNLLLALIFVFMLLGSLPSKPVEAASAVVNRNCTVWANSPTQTGSKLYTRGYAYCGMNGTTLPNIQLCIVKKTWYGKKDIGCTPVNFVGPMMGAWNATKTVYCDGKGTYYGEVRWKELSLKDVADIVMMIAIPPDSIWDLPSGDFGTKFAVQSRSYTYCG